MFLTNMSTYEGLPPRLQRTPKEIRLDISEIRRRIKEATDSLNARSILNEMLDVFIDGSVESFIPALEEILDDAKKTLSELYVLNENLDSLKEELKVTKCIMGI